MRNEERLTVGELAKRANVSVRTLQYYDGIGLLKPSAYSEGGRRLYTASDISVLHQIFTLKSLGFSLEEIKKQIISVSDLRGVVGLLENQVAMFTKQKEQIEKMLNSVELLISEIKVNQAVDWHKYSSMVQSIQENSEYYWMVQHLDKQLLQQILEQEPSGNQCEKQWWHEMFKHAIKLHKEGKDPKSEEAQQLAERWWHMMRSYSDGDATMMGKLVDFYDSAQQWPHEFRQLQQEAHPFLEKACAYYLEDNKIDWPRKDEHK
ncbi:MAG: MerR family transcriptional regulator [Bacilli bacterium]